MYLTSLEELRRGYRLYAENFMRDAKKNGLKHLIVHHIFGNRAKKIAEHLSKQ